MLKSRLPIVLALVSAAATPALAEKADPRETAWRHCLEKMGETLEPDQIEIRRITERGADTYKFYLAISAGGQDEPMDASCTASALKGVLQASAFEVRPVMTTAKKDG